MQIDKPTTHAELSCDGEGGNAKRKNVMEQIEMFGKHFRDYDDSMNQCLENLSRGEIGTRRKAGAITMHSSCSTHYSVTHGGMKRVTQFQLF